MFRSKFVATQRPCRPRRPPHAAVASDVSGEEGGEQAYDLLFGPRDPTRRAGDMLLLIAVAVTHSFCVGAKVGMGINRHWSYSADCPL